MRRRRNTHMKLRVLSTRFLLGCLLVLITALGDSYARVLPGQEVNKNWVEVTGIEAMHAQKESSFERNGVAAYMRKLNTTHEEEITTSMDSKNNQRRRRRRRSESDDNGDEGTNNYSKKKMISGKEEYGLHKSSSLEEQNNDQNKQRKVDAEASKFTKFCSQDHCNDDDVAAYKASMKSSSSRHEQQISSEEPEGSTNSADLQKHENQNLVEAAKEIANLMYMDYKGKPSHKPPINNHDPGN